jgi:xanthine dehydrogenase accessory factor
MKELLSIIKEYEKTDFSNRKAALATVVKVRGSSYRSPGARMLITDDGKWVGSISGGCLEGDALRKARQVMMERQSMTIVYDTREESNQSLGIGLGCNGVIDVLIEPIDPSDSSNPVRLFERLVTSQNPIVLATIFNSSDMRGQKFYISGTGELHCSFTNSSLKNQLQKDMTQVFEAGKSETKIYHCDNGPAEVFIEIIQPNISLIIFGGGFDARPVSELAKSMGWNVTVSDECVAHIVPIFFPHADKLSLCHREHVERDFDITPYTACLLMSHNYEYDRDVLKKILKSPTPYIGILGPRKRFNKMIDEFKAQGILISNEDMHRIYSPVGLDIGAETPDEIAVSIIAEIQAKFSNRSGGFLKYRNAPIHKRDSKNDQVFKQVYLSDIPDRKAGSL